MDSCDNASAASNSSSNSSSGKNSLSSVVVIQPPQPLPTIPTAVTMVILLLHFRNLFQHIQPWLPYLLVGGISLLVAAFLYSIWKHRKSSQVDTNSIQQLQTLFHSEKNEASLLSTLLQPVKDTTSTTRQLQTIQNEYSSLLSLWHHMFGIQPTTCAASMLVMKQAWTPALECSNILLLNCLNIPSMMMTDHLTIMLLNNATASSANDNGPPKDLIGLAMYASSLVAVSNASNSASNPQSSSSFHDYCYSFAIRRGVDAAILKQLAQDFHKQKGKLSRQHSSSSLGLQHSSSSLIGAFNERTGKQLHSTQTSQPQPQLLTKRQQVTIKMAYGLSAVPCTLSKETVDEAYQLFPRHGQVEWLVAAIAMCGYFQKLSDLVNFVAGEPTKNDTPSSVVGETAYGTPLPNKQPTSSPSSPPPLTPASPTAVVHPLDSWTTSVDILYQMYRSGGTNAHNQTLLRDIPIPGEECSHYLQQNITGCSFDTVIKSLHNDSIRRAVTAVMANNFSANETSIGLHRKLLVGISYCRDNLKNSVLQKELEQVQATIIARSDDDEGDDDALTQLVLRVGEAMSYHHPMMDPQLVLQQEIRDATNPATPGTEFHPSASMLVELASFLGTLEMLHRITSFDVIQKDIVLHNSHHKKSS